MNLLPLGLGAKGGRAVSREGAGQLWVGEGLEGETGGQEAGEEAVMSGSRGIERRVEQRVKEEGDRA